MRYEANSPEEYIEQVPEDRKEALKKLRAVLKKNLPKGFKEIMSDMIGYVVPHSIYPDGYHCDPNLPLPFISFASQKNFIALYHMGIYSDPELLNWFTTEFPKHCKRKLDMGKSCIRFKWVDDIPYDLIGELASRITPQQWIDTYESAVKSRAK